MEDISHLKRVERRLLLRFLRSFWLLIFPTVLSTSLYMYAGKIIGCSPYWGLIALLCLVVFDFVLVNAAVVVAFSRWLDWIHLREAVAKGDEEEVGYALRQETERSRPPRSR